MAQFAICVAALCLTTTGNAFAQEEALPGMVSTGMDYGAPPVSDFGGVSFFSQDLGTMLRLRYNTESYGQNDHGNLDIGTMQVLTFDDSITFVDGQVTLNDVQGVGFNVGAGFRTLVQMPHAPDIIRMEGVSIWADGTSTREDNFFPQLGISYESLGESWDLRANGYIPLGPQDKLGDFEPTGEVGMFQNFIGELTEAVVNSSLYAAELEVARRLGPNRDAWAFAGPYYLANDDLDSAGYRAGVRGYAYPDLLLQIAVSDDDIFQTNATFSITWFVGRTRTDYQPACGVPDRFREPVMRADYVVLAQSTAAGGNAFTDPTTGEAIRLVHVDSSAGPGGDGTFENPFDVLSDINGAGSMDGDIILAHGGSIFSGDTTTILKNSQRLLGEGMNIVHQVNTTQRGLIDIPETAPGARGGPRPMILDAMGDAIMLADGNEVNNFDIEGGTGSAIVGTDVDNVGTTQTNLRNLAISETAEDGLRILGDSDGTINVASTVSFTNIGRTAVDIDGGVDDEINGQITVNATIGNNTVNTGPIVSVQGVGAGGSSVFTGSIAQGMTAAGGGGIRVTSNDAGSRTEFTGPLTLRTGANTGFEATGGGVLAVTNTGNRIDTTTGQVALITGMTIANTGLNQGVAFNVVNRSTAAATSALQFENNTGGPINIGATTANIGDSGTLAGGNAAGVDAVVIRNSADVAINGVIINNAAGRAGVLVDKTTNAAMAVDLSDLQINGGVIGLDVETSADGDDSALTMTVNDSNFFGSSDFGLNFDNVDNGTIQVVNSLIDGNNPVGGSGIGVRILNSNANFTFDPNAANQNTIIRDWGGTDFLVQGGTTGTITFAGRIDNRVDATNSPNDTTGESVRITQREGGAVVFTSDSRIDDHNFGILIGSNSGGSVSFAGSAASSYDLDTGINTALTVSANTGGTYIFNNFDIETTSGDGVFISGNDDDVEITFMELDIETQSGQGFVATGGGELTVAGFNNTINRTAGGNNGSALHIEGMTIGAVDFERVSATGGQNGIRLVDNGGGTVTVGDTGNSAGQGGTISGTADQGVFVQNTDVVLNGVTVTNAGNAAGENAVEILHTNTEAMNANLNRLTVTNGTPGRDGVVIDGSGGSGTFNANIQNLNVNVTGDGLVVDDGVTLTAGGTNTIETDTGVGLRLTDIAIAPAGANFQSVNVSAGTSNGIFMEDVTGGQVAVTGVGNTADTGGTLVTAMEAIVLRNVQNVDVNNVRVMTAGNNNVLIEHTSAATTAMDVSFSRLNLDSTTGTGMSVSSQHASNTFELSLLDSDLENNAVVSVTGASQFIMLIDSSDFTTTGMETAFSLAFSGMAVDGDVTIRNGSNFTADDARAFNMTASNAAADIEFASSNSTFMNDSNTAETFRAFINGGAVLDANVVNNTFNNVGTADDFAMTSDGMSTQVNLNLDDNTTTGTYHLTTMNQGVAGTDFNFGVVERDTTAARNTGTVFFDPMINDFENISDVEPPTLP